MARYRARRKARAKAERERLEALDDAAAALGDKLRTMARAPGNPPRDAHRRAWTEALEASPPFTRNPQGTGGGESPRGSPPPPSAIAAAIDADRHARTLLLLLLAEGGPVRGEHLPLHPGQLLGDGLGREVVAPDRSLDGRLVLGGRLLVELARHPRMIAAQLDPLPRVSRLGLRSAWLLQRFALLPMVELPPLLPLHLVLPRSLSRQLTLRGLPRLPLVDCLHHDVRHPLPRPPLRARALDLPSAAAGRPERAQRPRSGYFGKATGRRIASNGRSRAPEG